MQDFSVINGFLITSYNFSVKTNSEDNVSIAISKKGGHIVYSNCNRDITEEKLSYDEANQKAKDFLNKEGFTSMKETYYLNENGIVTINYAYLPQDNTEYFNVDKNIMEWIGQYYDIKDETVLRGFLGRMLFSGDDVFKKVSVLSGGEIMRLVLARLVFQALYRFLIAYPKSK